MSKGEVQRPVLSRYGLLSKLVCSSKPEDASLLQNLSFSVDFYSTGPQSQFVSFYQDELSRNELKQGTLIEGED
jgi:hypothetical protein